MAIAQKEAFSEQINWTAVTGRCLAFLSLRNSDLKDATTLQQAEFLRALGLSTRESAALLGTTEQSINQLRYQQKQKKKRKVK